MLKALESIIKKEYQGEETLEGYIQFEEAENNQIDEKIKKLQSDVKAGTDKVFTMRLKDGLNSRLEKAVRFDGTTKSKVLRSLIEYYIVQVEQEIAKGENKIRDILMKDELEQMELVMKLSDEEKLQYLQLKKQDIENRNREDRINDNK